MKNNKAGGGGMEENEGAARYQHENEAREDDLEKYEQELRRWKEDEKTMKSTKQIHTFTSSMKSTF